MVDNGSSDNTVAELKFKFPQVEFISNTFNAGFSAANNQGFNMSRGDVLLFLNPDAKLINNNIFKAMALVEGNAHLIVGPKILNPDTSLQDSVIKIPDCLSVIKEALFLSYFFKPEKIDRLLESNNYALSGACLLMNRKLYESLNGFDENLFWMDDVDLSYRAKKYGAELLYDKEWAVIHTIGVSSKKNYNIVIANQLISKLKFFKKNNLVGDFIVATLFIQLHILLRIILFVILALFAAQYRKKLVAYLFTQKVFLRYIFIKENKIF
ncbi:MAG: glycosyl transferase family 2 [Bacteroidetes bacterium]|nr:glycosyl transferase family 2 [Bacteroidota bacterium]